MHEHILHNHFWRSVLALMCVCMCVCRWQRVWWRWRTTAEWICSTQRRFTPRGGTVPTVCLLVWSQLVPVHLAAPQPQLFHKKGCIDRCRAAAWTQWRSPGGVAECTLKNKKPTLPLLSETWNIHVNSIPASDSIYNKPSKFFSHKSFFDSAHTQKMNYLKEFLRLNILHL